jgi:hypothetical protein
VLANKRVNRDSGMNAWKNLTVLAGWYRFEHCEGAMFSVVRILPTPDHGKQLARPKVMADAAITTRPLADGIAETKAIGP